MSSYIDTERHSYGDSGGEVTVELNVEPGNRRAGAPFPRLRQASRPVKRQQHQKRTPWNQIVNSIVGTLKMKVAMRTNDEAAAEGRLYISNGDCLVIRLNNQRKAGRVGSHWSILIEIATYSELFRCTWLFNKSIHVRFSIVTLLLHSMGDFGKTEPLHQEQMLFLVSAPSATEE